MVLEQWCISHSQVSAPMVRAVVLQVSDAGPIPTGNICIIGLGMVSEMEKGFFHAQTTRQMLTPGERLNPPPLNVYKKGGLWVGASKPL